MGKRHSRVHPHHHAQRPQQLNQHSQHNAPPSSRSYNPSDYHHQQFYEQNFNDFNQHGHQQEWSHQAWPQHYQSYNQTHPYSHNTNSYVQQYPYSSHRNNRHDPYYSRQSDQSYAYSRSQYDRQDDPPLQYSHSTQYAAPSHSSPNSIWGNAAHHTGASIRHYMSHEQQQGSISTAYEHHPPTSRASYAPARYAGSASSSRGYHKSSHNGYRRREQHIGESRDHEHRSHVASATRTAPRDSYLEQIAAKPESLTEEEAAGRKLLVVLDLNGTLVFRAKGGAGRAIDSQRPCPRPYLSCFLQYCLGTESITSSTEPDRLLPELQRPHGTHFWQSSDPGVYEPSTRGQAEVVVWSSARPKNVDSMILASFDAKFRAKLLRVWARDTLVTPKLYYAKAESIKDLEIIWSELNLWNSGQGSSKRLLADARDRQDRERPDDQRSQDRTSAALESALEAAHLGPWGPHNTILVDDSPLKARLQPYNQLVIPEFGKDAASIMKRYIQQQGIEMVDVKISETEDDVAGSSRKASKEFAQRELSTETEPKYSPSDRSKQDAYAVAKTKKKPITEARLDNVLLQTIGVLETLRYQRNVSSFIYAGGIRGYGEGRGTLEQQKSRVEQGSTPEYWAHVGLRACQRMGIEVKPWTANTDVLFGSSDNNETKPTGGASPHDSLKLNSPQSRPS